MCPLKQYQPGKAEIPKDFLKLFYQMPEALGKKNIVIFGGKSNGMFYKSSNWS